jgi:sulfate adenylyltransferase (ADP) / ATP adenylyltransferase
MNGDSRILLQKGTLWEKIVMKTEEALKTGAQLPIPTAYEFIQDAGIRFFVRIISGLQQKDKDRRKRQTSSSSGKTINPFLPYQKALYVADISDTHVALLNKFNVVENHLLIITRHFEDQGTLLTLRDFEALWMCMAEYNALGFYNGGEAAGASQPHKHLQMAPLPLAPEGPGIPIEPLFEGAGSKAGPETVRGLPFLHGFVRLEHNGIDSPIDAARNSFVLYGNMLSHVGMETPVAKGTKTHSNPYCLLITREWMFLVPRSREFFNSISINSLGFAGALLVRNGEQMDFLKKHGPMTALKSVALPS